MVKTSGKILVAAIDGVDIAQDGGAWSGEHGDKHDDGGAEGLRGD